MKNVELEIEVRKLTEELGALKEVLNAIFSHPDLSMEIRKKWNALTKPPVESPVQPKPPEKGEAQKHLEYLGSLETIFKKSSRGESNANNTSSAAR